MVARETSLGELASVVDELWKRFIHQDAAWAEQWWNKEKDEGGYRKVVEERCPEKCGQRKCEHRPPVPLTKNDVKAHVLGKKTIGIYQLRDDTVRWFCLDVDVKKGGRPEGIEPQTRQLARLAQRLHLPFIVEQSGRRGYHIWFFTVPVQASKALLVGRCLADGVEPIDGISIEVFPKQIHAKTLGNLVKLPWGVHQKTGNRCLFVDHTFTPFEDQASALTSVQTISEQQLDDLIAQKSLALPTYFTTERAATGSLTPHCLLNIMEHGVKEGASDVATFKLACYFRDRGLPFEMAQAALEEWNRSRGLGFDHEWLMSKLRSAYSGSYSFFPCSEPLIDPYCDSSCKYYAKKMEQRKRTWKKH